ncbi:hypothetical protein [Sphingomonas sanxanigenens]|uniref:hypothetical protein n=1 Tax=Sphingomonas sanxanigenens TaxID=397260 RepID=UPI0013014A2F|nr:hypothetical protein [Sphingomonas sanxanigenens]
MRGIRHTAGSGSQRLPPDADFPNNRCLINPSSPAITAPQGGFFRALLDAAVKGSGPNAKEHWVFEDGFAQAGTTVVVYPGVREDVDGNFTYDGDGLSGVARQSIRSWVDDNSAFAIAGQEQPFELQDTYHPPNTIDGNIAFGITLGVGFAQGMRAFNYEEMHVDPSSIKFDVGNTSFHFDIVTPLNRPIRNRRGSTWTSGEYRDVGGVEVSLDGGAAWSYVGFSNSSNVGRAYISGRRRVTVAKAVGAWPSHLRVRIGKGGPFAYGTANPDGNEVARNYWLYDGDQRIINNGIGSPMRLSDAVYTVAAA